MTHLAKGLFIDDVTITLLSRIRKLRFYLSETRCRQPLLKFRRNNPFVTEYHVLSQEDTVIHERSRSVKIATRTRR